MDYEELAKKLKDNISKQEDAAKKIQEDFDRKVREQEEAAAAAIMQAMKEQEEAAEAARQQKLKDEAKAKAEAEANRAKAG